MKPWARVILAAVAIFCGTLIMLAMIGSMFPSTDERPVIIRQCETK